MSGAALCPLAGTTVLDLSRMLPGAVLARMLLDLGARLIKIEEPETGDPMRHLPPLVDGVGAGFCSFFRGAESVCLDLKDPNGASIVRRLAARTDVLVESFRPGTLEAWGLSPESLTQENPRLVICSLSGFGDTGPEAGRVGHDINFAAWSGLLSLIPGGQVPGIQVADVTSALLACSSVLAALLDRVRTNRGAHFHQPLASGPLPFLSFAIADAAAGADSAAERLLSGKCPAYRLYRCGDGLDLALGALEPKFWEEFTEMIGVSGAAEHGLDLGEQGGRAAQRVEDRLRTQPREHWLDLARDRNLPVTPVHDLNAAREALQGAGLLEETPAPGGTTIATPAPYTASVGATPRHPAPALGEHTERTLAELDL